MLTPSFQFINLLGLHIGINYDSLFTTRSDFILFVQVSAFCYKSYTHYLQNLQYLLDAAETYLWTLFFVVGFLENADIQPLHVCHI